jgi:hypothetical protein
MQLHAGEKKGNKLKIILKTPQSHAAGQDDAVDDGDASDDIADFTPLTEQQGFTSRELAMDTESLWKLCVANLKWATKEGDELREECKEAEEVYRQEWLEKEALVNQASQIEEDWWQRRKVVLAAEADIRAINNQPPDDDSNDAMDTLYEDRLIRTSQPV